MFNIEFMFGDDGDSFFTGIPKELADYLERENYNMLSDEYHALLCCENIGEISYLIENIFDMIVTRSGKNFHREERWLVEMTNSYKDWSQDFILVRLDKFGLIYIFRVGENDV